MSPITLVFTHRPRYIHKFLYKIFWGAPSKITPHFLDFSKKSATQKTRFFPVGRNFGHLFLKKAQKSSILGSPIAKIFVDKLSIKNSDPPKILVGTLPIDILWLIFEKTFLRFLFFWGGCALILFS